MSDKKQKKEKEAEDLENVQKIIADNIVKQKDFLGDIAYNIAKGFGESSFLKNIKKIDFEYITESSKMRVEISMNPFTFATVAVSEPTDKPIKPKKE